jgi:hypothetical protein
MLKMKTRFVLLTVCAFLTFLTVQVLAQGTSRQEYSGLD